MRHASYEVVKIMYHSRCAIFCNTHWTSHAISASIFPAPGIAILGQRLIHVGSASARRGTNLSMKQEDGPSIETSTGMRPSRPGATFFFCHNSYLADRSDIRFVEREGGNPPYRSRPHPGHSQSRPNYGPCTKE